MDMPSNRFKHLIAHGGRVPLGCWLVSGSAVTAEAMGCAGYDFLVLDTEHTPIDMAGIAETLRTIEGTPAGVLVRLPWNDPVFVKRTLDAGAQSLMFPFIQAADEARRAVASTRYPPEGVRGVAAVHRASRYGNVANYQKNAAAALCVVCQIETLDALDRLPEIAAVPGVDALFIGPADLSASMGLLGNMAHPDVLAKLEQGAQACRRLGKPVGIVGPTPEMVAKYVEFGFSWVALGSDIALMVGRAHEWIAKLRAAAPSVGIRPAS